MESKLHEVPPSLNEPPDGPAGGAGSGFTRLAACAAILVGLPFGTLAQETVQVVSEAAEIQRIERELNTLPEFSAQVSGKKVILARMTKFKARIIDEGPDEELIETLHYRYDDGKTIRAKYLPRARKLVEKLAVEAAYPTPLSAQETERAITLAQEKNLAIRNLFATKGKAGLEVSLLAPVISNKRHALYGKRLAIVQVRPVGEATGGAQITINLTDESVEKL